MIKSIKIRSLFICLLVFIFFSCQKDQNIPVPVPDLEGGILLEIKPDQNSYIGETGNHYYSNTFSSRNDSALYRLKVNKGVKYHILCSQPDLEMNYIYLVLLNSKRDTLATDSIPYWKNFDRVPELFFDSNITDDVFLKVQLKNVPVGSLKYNIYFETCKPKTIDFLNFNWETSGNWQVIDTQTLQFNSSDSREFRWIRLNSIIPDNQDISFTLKSETKKKLPSFGFIFNGSSKLINWGDYDEELPNRGTFLNITDNESYRIIRFTELGIVFDYGSINIPNLNITNGVNITIRYNKTYASKMLYINDIPVYSFSPASINKFYLVVEDKSFDKFIFENVTFKEN